MYWKTLALLYGDFGMNSDSVNYIETVPDRRSRILEVVIVRRLAIWVLGIWRGEG
jgi:hypothetical protein